MNYPIAIVNEPVKRVCDKLLALFSALAFDLPGASARRTEQSQAMQPSDEDKKVFSDIATGSEEAFERFYNMTSSQVYGYCLRMAKSQALAVELMQEAYVQLWEGRKSLHNVTYPRAYIMRIASRCVYRYLTNNAARRQIMELNEATNVINLDTPTSAAMETKEILQRIEKAVLQLPPQQQLVFRLCKYDGLSYQQIANQLSIAVPTVSRNITEAMKKVRSHVLGVE
jgi:RNA polymerase sigma-70 factor (ECF subfamily)